MATYVAFLRGINVGGHTVKNNRLRALFEELGFHGPQTFLASGNVIFENGDAGPSAVEGLIESHLRDRLGYDVNTFVRTGDQLIEVASHAPFPDAAEDGKLHIGFLRDELDRSTKDRVASLAKDTDRVAFRGRELYWHLSGRFMDSALSEPAIGRLLGDAWTVRTANTIRRIAAKLPS